MLKNNFFMPSQNSSKNMHFFDDENVPLEVITAPAEQQTPEEYQKSMPLEIPQYHVVLLDDDDHSYQYVIEMLMKLFSHTQGAAYKMAHEVDKSGRVIVFTTHRERAEIKRDQIHQFGADWRIPNCVGAMSAIIEAVEE